MAAVVLVLVCVAPLLASGFDALTRAWHPAGDWSVLELRIRDTGSAHTALIGPYSRFGWNHPGPLLFWLFAVPYRLLGQTSTSVLLTAALTNVVAVAGLAVFAWRRGRLPLVAASMIGTALLCTHLGPSFLRDPWNPSVTVLPFAVFVVLAWSAWEGDRVAPPLLAFVGSVLVQSHVGFALVVATLGVVAVVGFARSQAERRVSLVWAGVVLGLCWLPVVVDQVLGTGNLGALGRYFLGGGSEAPAGWTTGLGVLARELGVVAPWLGGAERGRPLDGGVMTASATALVVPVLAFAGALVAARSRRADSAVRFQVVVAATVVAGYLSVARVTGPVYAYLVRWLWVVALLWWLSVFWSLWSSAFASRPAGSPVAGARPERSWSPSPAFGAVVLTAVALVAVGRTSLRTAEGIGRIGTPDGEWHVTLDEIVDDVVRETPREHPVVVRAVGSANGSIADAIRLQLDRADVSVVVEEDQVHKYGRRRLVDPGAPVAVMTVVTGTATEPPPGTSFGRPVAAWDPLTSEERSAALALEERLADQLSLVGRNDLITAMRTGGSLDAARAVGGIDQELLQVVERFRREGDPVTVYVDDSAQS